jgi:hypothetical protein
MSGGLVLGESSMKNEWDILALVQRRLAAGQRLVEFPYVTRWLVEPGGSPGRVRDEDGTEYEVGPDFLSGVVPALRAGHISYGIDNWQRVLSFGPGLRPLPTSYVVNGQEIPVVNLTPDGPVRLVELLITSSEPAPENPADTPAEDDAAPLKS